MLRSARILGSGGFVPTGRRETSCLLLLRGADGGAVVIDAGTGLRRLVTDPALLAGVDELDLVLTHFHPDHLLGLPFLGALDVAVRLWGPGLALYGRPTEDVLATVFSDPVYPAGVRGLAAQIGDVALGETSVGDLAVTTRAQRHHPNPTLGLRFGDQLAWCTDTEDDPATAAFSRGVQVLCHDAWSPEPAEGHTTPAQAASRAAEAGVPRLVLIHVAPGADEAALLADAAPHHPDVRLAEDGLELLSPR